MRWCDASSAYFLERFPYVRQTEGTNYVKEKKVNVAEDLIELMEERACWADEPLNVPLIATLESGVAFQREEKMQILQA